MEDTQEMVKELWQIFAKEEGGRIKDEVLKSHGIDIGPAGKTTVMWNYDKTTFKGGLFLCDRKEYDVAAFAKTKVDISKLERIGDLSIDWAEPCINYELYSDLL